MRPSQEPPTSVNEFYSGSSQVVFPCWSHRGFPCLLRESRDWFHMTYYHENMPVLPGTVFLKIFICDFYMYVLH